MTAGIAAIIEQLELPLVEATESSSRGARINNKIEGRARQGGGRDANSLFDVGTN